MADGNTTTVAAIIITAVDKKYLKSKSGEHENERLFVEMN